MKVISYKGFTVKIHYLGKEFPKYLVGFLFLLGIFLFGLHNNSIKTKEIQDLRQQLEVQSKKIQDLQAVVIEVKARPPSVIHHHHVKKIVIKKYVSVKPLTPLPPLDFSNFLIPLPTMPGIQDATGIGLPPP